MPIEAGQQLLHYRLIEKIGEGGMGVVWQALDTALDREVAIKVLPAAFAEDAERLGRFEREAKLLASLNHPHIASVFGLHRAGDVHFLAMELIPGEDLARRLRRGALQMDEALSVARAVAAALESAHQRGVIHRDLKPSNIQLTPDGEVKVLDFGLAKATAADAASSGGSFDPATSPTLTSTGTMAGVILGTAAYMSPEQARGGTVDRRADIWAFGCVLYEMLTGTRTFPGETLTEILGAVLHVEPDFSRLPPETPQAVRRLLRRCLRKVPKQRLRDMGDAGLELAEALEVESADDPVAIMAAARRGWVSLVPWAVAGVALVAALLAWRQEAPPPQVTRTTLELPEGMVLRSGIAISTDGRRVVFAAAERDGTQRLYLRALDRFEAEPIAGTESATEPFFAPDDRWVGFHADGEIRKVSVTGGAPTTIVASDLQFGAVWAPDDTILFGRGLGSGLSRVSAAGGEADTLTTPDIERGEVSHGRPSLLPDGDTVLFTIGTGKSSDVGLLSLASGEWRVFLEGAAGARYLSIGQLVHSKGGTLRSAPFDRSRLELSGVAVPVLEGLRWNNTGGLETASFAVAAAGTLVYLTGGNVDEGSRIVLVDRDGNARRVDLEQGRHFHPAFSPDGRRLALTGSDRRDYTGDIWVVDLERGSRTRLTVEGTDYTPIWTPDGKRIAYVSNGNMLWTAADGSGKPEPLLVEPPYQRPTSFSRDGSLLAFTSSSPEGVDLGVLSLADGSVTRFSTPFRELAPAFSPDGRWLAYASNESGRDEIYVQAWPGPGARVVVSTDGGGFPRWSADGSELYYRNEDRVMVVAVKGGAQADFAKPRVLFTSDHYKQEIAANYDVAPDGRTFVMVEFAVAKVDRVRVVQGWFEELRAER